MPIFQHAPTQESLLLRFGSRHKWLVLLVVSLGMVSAVLSTTSFSVAIPALGRHFGLGQDQVQWVITGFMGAMTLSMLPTPWLLDRFGFRRCFLVATLLLGVTSIAGSLVTEFVSVVTIRLLQGAAAGVLQPLGTLAVMRQFPIESQGRASGALSFGIVLAPAVAPSLGGMLVDHFGWQSIFLLNVPFCLAAIWSGLYLLPQPKEIHSRSFDWLGVGLLGLATLSMVEGIASLRHTGSNATWTLLLLSVVLVSIGVFIWHGLHTSAPVISLGLFRDRSFAMGVLVFFTYGFGLYASTYLIPIFLQSALGFSAAASGLALLPSGIALALAIPVAGRLADQHSPQKLTIAGLVLFGLSFLLFAATAGHLSYGVLILITVIGRIGLALILPALSLATLRHIKSNQLGQASMATSYARQLGGVLGIAIVAVSVTWRESVHGITAPGIFTAFSENFLLLAATFFIAVIAASRMKRHLVIDSAIK